MLLLASIPPSGERELQLLLPWGYPLGSTLGESCWLVPKPLAPSFTCQSNGMHPKNVPGFPLDIHFNVLNLVCL